MTKTQTYNGWTNWHTWNAFNWLDSDENTQFTASTIARSGYAHELCTYFVETFGQGHDGIDVDAVDWHEIKEAFI